jgi:hypothetical protein
MRRRFFDWRRQKTRLPSRFQRIFHFDRSQGSGSGQQKEPSAQLNGNIEPLEQESRAWNPFWLRRSFLFTTASTFVVLIVALFLLLYLAKKTDGLVLLTTNHFSWTYGPTAVLTILVAFWRQIDFYCKGLAPWQELQQGNADPRKSVLLDYKSPLQIVSLYTAAKNRHGTVAVTILGFIILKLVTLASTGLLFPESVSLPASNVRLQQSTRLNGSLYNETANQGLFDPSIAYTAFAVMTKGLPYPDGMTTGMLYEQFTLPPAVRSVNGTTTARVRGLMPTYHCESAPVTIKLQPANVTDLHPEDTIELLFPECTLRSGGEGTSVYALNPQTFVCPDRQLSPLLQQIDCNTGPDNWQLLTLADFRYKQTILNSSGLSLGDPVAASSWFTEVEQVTGIACKSAFSVQDVELSYDFSSTPPTIQTTILLGENNSTTLGNFTGFDLGVLTTSALSASADMFGNLVDNANVLEYPNVLFKMMAAVSGGTYEDLLNETTMIESAQRVLQEVALQSVAKFLVGEDQSGLSGTLVQEQEKLQVSKFSVSVMLFGCFVMALFTLFLLCKRARDVFPCNPEPLSSTAKLLADSGEFMDILTGVGGGGDKEMDSKLETLKFSTHPRRLSDDLGFSLTLSPHTTDSAVARTQTNSIPQSGQQSWWSPLTLKRPILVISLSLPLFALGILELLQQLSDRRAGFTSLPSSSSLTITIFTRFFPALLMLVVATLANALDFNIAVLAPFKALHADIGEQAERSILSSNLGLPLPLALWQSLKHRQWGPFLSGCATLIASVLTIVVSGLYTVEKLPVSQTVTLNLGDRFNVTWSDSVKNDSSAAVVTSLTESLDLDYPQYTYGELALPALNPIMIPRTNVDLNQLLQVRLAALRSDLECVRLPADMMNVSATYNFRIATAQASVFAQAPLPAVCPLGGVNGTAKVIEFSNTFALHGNSSFVGKLIDLHVGPFDPIQDTSFGELSPNTQVDNPPGCPSLAFIYGFADVNNPTKTIVTTLMCYQYIDQIQTNVSFTLGDLSIPSNQPPIVDESSSKRLPSGSNNETAFQFRLQLHMDDEFSSFNQTADMTSTLAESSSPLDHFFQGVLFGKVPLDQALLASTNEAEVSQVFGGIRGFYRRYMAQAISSNMRVPFGVAETHLANGTILNAQLQPRIVQNRTAKIVLQVQLGLIFVLDLLAVSFSKLYELVPFNPCTIAGVAALFAWSRMCDVNDPVGRDIFGAGDDRLRDERYRFRLGWWDIGQREGAQRRMWYGIDAVDVKEEG